MNIRPNLTVAWWAAIVVYTAFFSLIGFAVWWTDNANCLWALLLTPNFRYNDDDDDEDKEA